MLLHGLVLLSRILVLQQQSWSMLWARNILLQFDLSEYKLSATEMPKEANIDAVLC